MQLEWPLLGRERELAAVTTVLRPATAKRTSDRSTPTGPGGGPEPLGVVLVGPGGVGKTRLAGDCLERLARHGAVVRQVRATRASAAIALGALSPLLPDVEGEVDLPSMVRDALVGLAPDRRLLLSVDDAQLLDETSTGIVLDLVANGDIALLATIRQPTDLAGPFVDAWPDCPTLVGIDVGPLPDDDVAELVRLTLDAEASSMAVDELARLSRGNPLALREILLSLRDAGATSLGGDESWQLPRPLPVSDRLVDLIGHRLGALDEAQFDAVAAVALTEPVRREVVEAVVTAAALDDVVERGLVAVEERTGEPAGLRLEHPLFGEVLRSSLGVVQTRKLLRSLADAALDAPTVRPADRLRAVVWRLEGGERLGGTDAVEAGRQAMAVHDSATAHRIAAAAWNDHPSFELGQVLAFSLADLGRFDEADTVLVTVAGMADSDEDLASLAIIQSECQYRAGRAELAADTMTRAEAAITDPGWRQILETHRATLLLLSGQIAEARATASPCDSEDAHPLARHSAAVVLGTADTWDGHPLDAVTRHEEAYARGLTRARAETVTDTLQEYNEFQVVGIIQGLTQAGRLAEADTLLDLAWQAGSAAHAQVPMAWVSVMRALQEAARGHAGDLLRWSRVSADLWRSSGLYGRVHWAAGLEAMALALLGRPDEAAAVMADIEAHRSPVRFLDGLVDDAHGWVLAADGRFDEARAACATGATRARTGDQRTAAATALHSLARLGDPEAAVEPLRALAPELQGALPAARVAHVLAMAAGDADGLEAAAGAFEALGATLPAAEAWADAARQWRLDRQAARGTAAAERSAELAGRCQGAMTPALVAVEAAVPLTFREREVALLAARNLTSRTIGERLGLGRRTVESHLANIYGKLGVSGRDGLVAAGVPVPRPAHAGSGATAPRRVGAG